MVYITKNISTKVYQLRNQFNQCIETLLQLMDFRRHTKVCQYFLQGRCKFGSSCRYLHSGLQTYLMRHASSEFNEATQSFCRFGPKFYNTQKQLENLQENANYQPFDVYSQEAKVFQLNKNLIDCNVTEKGKKQIQNIGLSGFLYQKIEVDILFVSPLERALETASLMLQQKKVSCQRVIVFPQLTQVLSKICDFGKSIAEKIKKYPKFDFELFFISVQQSKNKEIANNAKRQAMIKWQDKMISDPKLKPDQTKQYGQRYLSILETIFPQPLEDRQQCFNRVIQTIEKIKKIAEVCQAQRIMVISHNRILKYFCGRFNRGIAKSFENCQIRKVYI